MFKLFTLESAQHLLPTVDLRLRELHEATGDLERLRERVGFVRHGSLEAYALSQELAFVARSVRDARNEVRRLGVLVPDVDAGTVEFPSRVDGEIVHLVWQRGDDAIRAYHRLAGDERLRPLAGRDDASRQEAFDATSIEDPSGASSSTTAGSNRSASAATNTDRTPSSG